MPKDQAAKISISQGRRIGKAIQYFEAHGRNHVGPIGPGHNRGGSISISGGGSVTYTRTTISGNSTASFNYVLGGTIVLSNGLYQVTGSIVATKTGSSSTIEAAAGFSTDTVSFDDGYYDRTKFTGSELFNAGELGLVLPTRIVDNRTGGTMTMYPVMIGAWTAFSGGSMTFTGSYTVLKLG